MSIEFKWKDVSSYSQSEPRESRIPSIWEMRIDNSRYPRFVVHRLIGSDGWYFSCDDLYIRDQELPIGSHATPEEVKQKGIEWIIRSLSGRIDRYQKIVNALVLDVHHDGNDV